MPTYVKKSLNTNTNSLIFSQAYENNKHKLIRAFYRHYMLKIPKHNQNVQTKEEQTRQWLKGKGQTTIYKTQHRKPTQYFKTNFSQKQQVNIF